MNSLDNNGNDILLLKHFHEFSNALVEQLKNDNKRFGITYLNRSRKGQERRIELRYNEYFDNYMFDDIPIPWMKVVGNAYIAWLRENHPEMSKKWKT